jgi:hypothetical protein
MLMAYPQEKVLKIDQANDCLYLIQRNGEAKVFHYIDGEIKEGLILIPE